MSVCLIRQPAGLGDILFLQKAIWFLKRDHDLVIHPVLPQLEYLKDTLNTQAHITSLEKARTSGYDFPADNIVVQEKFENGRNLVYIHFEKASINQTGCVMRSKYRLVNCDWGGWQDFVSFNRNGEKEKELETLLDLPPEYNFLNKKFGTYPGTLIKNQVKAPNDLPVVELNFIPGFTIFDWLGVIQKAVGIYTVDTSILFLMEKIHLQAEKLELWSRNDHYQNVDGLFNLKWHYN